MNKMVDNYEITKEDILFLEEKKKEIIENRERKKVIDTEDFMEIFAYDFIKQYPCYYNNDNILFAYDIQKNKWSKSDERELICIAKNLMSKSGLNNSQVRSSFTNAILDRARWEKPLEVMKEWIHFDNCFYDLNTDEKIEPDRKYFSQIKIPHKLGLSDETPIIDKHIKSWVGEKQYNLFVQICAYCMYKDYPFARFFIFYGTGQDGKSTAGEFISNLIGEDNRCTINLDQLEKNRFESQKMYQKTLAICGEVDYNLLKNTRQLKGCTGGDPLTIEFKQKNPFTYKNFAKLLWYANGIPPTYDKTQGFYRRTIILKFPNKFSECSNPLSNITEEEYENFCFKCLNVLKDLLKNGFDEKEIEEKILEYEELSNPVKKFIKECLSEGKEDDFLLMEDLCSAYNTYAKKKSYRTFHYKDFLSMFRAEEFIIERKRLSEKIDGGYHLYKKDTDFYTDKDVRKQVIIGYKIVSLGQLGQLGQQNTTNSPIGKRVENSNPINPINPKGYVVENL